MEFGNNGKSQRLEHIFTYKAQYINCEYSLNRQRASNPRPLFLYFAPLKERPILCGWQAIQSSIAQSARHVARMKGEDDISPVYARKNNVAFPSSTRSREGGRQGRAFKFHRMDTDSSSVEDDSESGESVGLHKTPAKAAPDVQLLPVEEDKLVDRSIESVSSSGTDRSRKFRNVHRMPSAKKRDTGLKIKCNASNGSFYNDNDVKGHVANIRCLFDKANHYIQPGPLFRSVVRLYAERKLLVFFFIHFMSTMIIWCE